MTSRGLEPHYARACLSSDSDTLTSHPSEAPTSASDQSSKKKRSVNTCKLCANPSARGLVRHYLQHMPYGTFPRLCCHQCRIQHGTPSWHSEHMKQKHRTYFGLEKQLKLFLCGEIFSCNKSFQIFSENILPKFMLYKALCVLFIVSITVNISSPKWKQSLFRIWWSWPKK